MRLHGECLRPVGASRAGRTRTGSRKDSVPLISPRALSGPASGPGSRLVRAAKGSSGPPQPSSHSWLPFSSTALTSHTDQKHPPPQLLASVPRPTQLQAAAPCGSPREGRSPGQPTGAGPHHLPRGRRGGRPPDSSVREGRLTRRVRHAEAAAPAHAPRGPLSRGFPRQPSRDGPT